MVNIEVVSDKQKIYIVSFFVTGQSLLFIGGVDAKQDFWLSIILSTFMSFIMAFIYARLHNDFPGRDFFDIVEICLGKLIGKIIILFYIWFTFEYTSSMLGYFGIFVSMLSFPQTPKIILTICAGIVCMWIVKAGIEVIARCTEIFLPFTIVMVLIATSLLIPQMDVDRLYPILYNGIQPVLKGTFSTFMSPFSDILILTMIFSSFKTKQSPYKIYILGLLIAGVLLSISSLTNILVLGVNTSLSTYAPSFSTFARINVGRALQRMEIISSTVFFLVGFIKASILLLATCKGITKLCGCIDYRFIVIPITLLAINLSYFEFDSIMHVFEFSFGTFNYYAIPFLVIFPIVIFIIGEIRKKLIRKQLG